MQSPRFGFGSGTRDETKLKLQVPGPGSYKPKTITGADGPAKTMSATLKFAPAVKEGAFKPGPGSYAGDVKFKTMR